MPQEPPHTPRTHNWPFSLRIVFYPIFKCPKLKARKPPPEALPPRALPRVSSPLCPVLPAGSPLSQLLFVLRCHLCAAQMCVCSPMIQTPGDIPVELRAASSPGIPRALLSVDTLGFVGPVLGRIGTRWEGQSSLPARKAHNPIPAPTACFSHFSFREMAQLHGQ